MQESTATTGTYSVKISADDQSKLKRFVEESGLSNKDFFAQLLSCYELNQVKAATPIIGADVDELETLTRRINNIIIGISERIHTLELEANDKVRQAQESNAATIKLLEKRLTELEQAHQDEDANLQSALSDKAAAERMVAGLNQRVAELEAVLSDKQALIDAQTSIVSLIERLQPATIPSAEPAASRTNRKLARKADSSPDSTNE